MAGSGLAIRGGVMGRFGKGDVGGTHFRFPRELDTAAPTCLRHSCESPVRICVQTCTDYIKKCVYGKMITDYEPSRPTWSSV